MATFHVEFYGDIDHKLDEPPVGITTWQNENGIDYVCAAGVSTLGRVPKGCIKVTLPPAVYAVFAHDDHVTQLRQPYNAIWNDWFPKSGRIPQRLRALRGITARLIPAPATAA